MDSVSTSKVVSQMPESITCICFPSDSHAFQVSKRGSDFAFTMSYSRRTRYSSRSCSPYQFSRSVLSSSSRSRSRSHSRSCDSSDVENPGNTLYVTGLSSRITKKELENHFESEGGKVIDCRLVVDPRTRESRGFGFITMATVKDADRCLKYLNRSVLEGRVLTVEKGSCV